MYACGSIRRHQEAREKLQAENMQQGTGAGSRGQQEVEWGMVHVAASSSAKKQSGNR